MSKYSELVLYLIEHYNEASPESAAGRALLELEARVAEYAPLQPPSESGREVFESVVKNNPEADMRAVPNEWATNQRAITEEVAAKLEARVAEMAEAQKALDADFSERTEELIRSNTRMAELEEALQAMYDCYEGVYDMAVPTVHQSDEAKQAEALARETLNRKEEK